jgi:hypothetical protein
MILITARICVAGVLTALFSTAAFSLDGRPVAPADLVGKKICWDDGHTGAFAANGQFTNEQGQHATWSIGDGVLHVGNNYRETVVLADGRLQQHWFVGRSARGADKYRWGTVCN